MKNNILNLILFLSILFLSMSCSKKDGYRDFAKGDLSLPKVLVHSKLRVGIDPTNPPMCYAIDGKIVGFDVDVFKAVTDFLDIDVEFVTINWDKRLELLNSEEIDCLAGGISKTPEREAVYELTEPYIRNAQVIVILKNSPYRKIKDLKGKTIGVHHDSFIGDFFKTDEKYKNYFKDIRKFSTKADGLGDLQNRGIDAFVLDLTGLTNIMKTSINKYSIIEESLGMDFFVYAFKKGSVSLRNEINETLNQLAEAGTLEQISRKWFNADIVIVGK